MEAANEPLLWLTLLAMLVGLVGSVLPGLPGVPLIFLSALIYSYLTGFEIVGGWLLALLGLFAALAMVADFVATTYGARRFGASHWGTAGGAIGGVAGALAGFLFLGIGALLGLLLGTLGGVVVGEYLRRRRRRGEQSMTAPWDWRRASQVAGGVLVGYVASAVAQGVLALLSVIVFVLALFY